MGALLFPGQGSQIVGMGSEFFNNFEKVKKIFSAADEKLNFPISKLILNGPEDKLQLTQNTQPAILTVSYSIFRIMVDEFGFDLKQIKFFAGHSLGEYSALVCAESLNFLDALYLLNERGKAMQEAVPLGKGAMIAVLGINIDEVKNLIQVSQNDRSGICEIANDNAEGQVIVSGDSDNIKNFQKFLKEKKIKSIPLKVSAPFHCALMKKAAESMREKINNTNFNDPKFNIVSNVKALPENKAKNIKNLLIDQIFNTVRWRESIINISVNGVSNFIEIGPGKVLTGMVKRTLSNPKSFSINSIADIKNLENEFKK
ncbi:ACP S-malonyltransferase [Candidatus Pelagibacter bacterium]|nr:ACP S-malonyltransferase [Candidatus Pelagibacter bacterium]